MRCKSSVPSHSLAKRFLLFQHEENYKTSPVLVLCSVMQLFKLYMVTYVFVKSKKRGYKSTPVNIRLFFLLFFWTYLYCLIQRIHSSRCFFLISSWSVSNSSFRWPMRSSCWATPVLSDAMLNMTGSVCAMDRIIANSLDTGEILKMSGKRVDFGHKSSCNSSSV